MILFALSYLAGVLTIASPCILPVLPFVFARADRPFVRSGLPMLAGMAVAFAAVATLAAVAGSWVVTANTTGRWLAMALLFFFGLTLLVPQLADRLSRPVVDLGARLSRSAEGWEGADGGILPSLVLGVATGLLWAPCAGPVLGLILTGAAIEGASVGTSFLLLAYAAGAATSLALALLVGGRVFTAMKRSLGAGEWVRRGLGAAVLVAVAAIALGLDTGFLANASLTTTTSLEERLIDALKPAPAAVGTEGSSVVMSGGPAMAAPTGGPAMAANGAGGAAGPAMMGKPPADGADSLPIQGDMPSLLGATDWLNSPPLGPESLKGKVVLVDFWTYSCINCLRTIPYVRAWAEKYKDQGLVVVGVHTPEFAFERSLGNVKKAITDLKIGYPVAVDNEYRLWRAFENRYWPAHYFVDADGHIRHQHFGEGGQERSERVLQRLLAEAGHGEAGRGLVDVDASGAEAASDAGNVRSPETYIGYDRAENFVSPGGAVPDAPHNYALGMPRLNEWSLVGAWTIGGEHADLNEKDGSVVYRFHARDLHLVLGPAPDGRPIRFRVTLDGKPPGDSRGIDVDADGQGTISEQRLYQLVRQQGPVGDRTFEIRFFEPGVQVYAFTFG